MCAFAVEEDMCWGLDRCAAWAGRIVVEVACWYVTKVLTKVAMCSTELHDGGGDVFW